MLVPHLQAEVGVGRSGDPADLPAFLSRATAVTFARAEALRDSARTVRVPLPMSGVLTILSTAVLATGSIQTVCQMPEDWV